MGAPRRQPQIITLMTDFGLSDTYVGVMKGVILSIAPQAQLVDLTHDIAPQNILEGSVRLEAAIDYFPAGTVHLAVVDPGVGSKRRACVVQTERALFVAPDNGLLTHSMERQRPLHVVWIEEAALSYCLQPMSATFHGRDLFAPIAAHLANGLPLDALGTVQDAPAVDLNRLDLPEPQGSADASQRQTLRLHLLYSDHFGNLITDLTPARWEDWRQEIAPEMMPNEFDLNVTVCAGSRQWHGLSRTFADVPEGAPLAYRGSGGRFVIGVRNGSAVQTLRLDAGDSIRFLFDKQL